MRLLPGISWVDNKASRGVTLMEMLLVASIFAIVSAGVATSFVSGIKIWNRAKNSGLAKYEVPFLFISIGKELRQSAGAGGVDFSGTQEEFTFPGVAEHTITKITYAFNPHDKTFVRRSVPVSQVLAGKEKSSAREKVVALFDTCTVSYLYFDQAAQQYFWKDAWAQERSRWSAIRLQVTSKGKEYETRVYMPQA